MKTYGTILAYTPQRNNIQLGNVVNQDFNQVYKSIHSFKVSQPEPINVKAKPQPLKPKTNAEKQEELRDLMQLYYKVKLNEYTAQGAVQPAFQISPYSEQFNYIHSTGLEQKRAKLLAVQDYERRTGRQFKATATLKQPQITHSSQVSTQQQPQLSTQTVKATTKRRPAFSSPTASAGTPTQYTPSAATSTAIGDMGSVAESTPGTTPTKEKRKIIKKLEKQGAKKLPGLEEPITRKYNPSSSFSSPVKKGLRNVRKSRRGIDEGDL
jgi:hypothetical protein